MNTNSVIKIYLNKEVHKVSQGATIASGTILPASGLVQLDAFLTGVREALKEQPNAVDGLVGAISAAASKATSKGHLLTLNISSTLDIKNHTLSYSFELRTE